MLTLLLRTCRSIKVHVAKPIMTSKCSVHTVYASSLCLAWGLPAVAQVTCIHDNYYQK